ncbi:MAG: superoxide dismutase [Chloroflexota bacterium]|nr:superoxide dismutase [Chloroflexota bacterium]
MAFELPPLPYAYEALNDTIDTETMHLHHDKHHQAYVNNLNAAVEGTAFADMSIDELVRNVNQAPADKKGAIRNNGGGHYNHSMFWEIMTPGGPAAPSGDLAAAIEAFGGVDALKDAVNKAGAGRFGSGWTWVIVGADGKLAVVSTPNQDNPLMTGIAESTGYPILGNDVWEHAYYLKYQNRRPDYLAAWWNVVNWDKVAERFANARAAQG